MTDDRVREYVTAIYADIKLSKGEPEFKIIFRHLKAALAEATLEDDLDILEREDETS